MDLPGRHVVPRLGDGLADGHVPGRTDIHPRILVEREAAIFLAAPLNDIRIQLRDDLHALPFAFLQILVARIRPVADGFVHLLSVLATLVDQFLHVVPIRSFS